MRRALALIAALSLLLTAAVAPVTAARPQTVLEPIWFVWPDLTHNKVVFWNTTREAVCAWEERDFADPLPNVQPVPVVYNETPTGAVVSSFRTTSHLELWELDVDAPLTGPCEDTDDSTAPWAVGSAHVTSNDNDLFHGDSIEMGLRRYNAFGDRGQGSVVDTSGTRWHYSWVTHVVLGTDLEDEIVVNFVHHSLLRRR